MKVRANWQELTEPEILDEVRIREDLIRQMVGWLYPSILRDEINDLYDLYDKREAEARKELLNQPILFGLRAQGHIPTIKKMLAEGTSWDEIGKVIHWDPATAKDFYEREGDSHD